MITKNIKKILISTVLVSLLLMGMGIEVNGFTSNPESVFGSDEWTVGIGYGGIYFTGVKESITDSQGSSVYVLGEMNESGYFSKYIAAFNRYGQLKWNISNPYTDTYSTGLALSPDGSRLYTCYSENTSVTFSAYLQTIDTESGSILSSILLGENRTTIMSRIAVDPADENRLFISWYGSTTGETQIFEYNLDAETVVWNYTLAPLSWGDPFASRFNMPIDLVYNPTDGYLYHAGIDGNMVFSYGGRIIKIEPASGGTREVYNLTASHAIMTMIYQMKVEGNRIYLLGNNYTSGPGEIHAYVQIYDLNFMELELLHFNDQFLRINRMIVASGGKNLVLGGFHYYPEHQPEGTIDDTPGILLMLSNKTATNTYSTDQIVYLGVETRTNVVTMSYADQTGDLFVGGYTRVFNVTHSIGYISKFSSIYGSWGIDDASFWEELQDFFTDPSNWPGIGITAGSAGIVAGVIASLIARSKGKGKKK